MPIQGSYTNEQLMATIRTRWGATIAYACRNSAVPPHFLAALIANESGGDASVKRFEAAVLVSLWNVLTGRKATFGSIGRQDLLDYLIPSASGILGGLQGVALGAVTRLDGLATSWGLTQIMGYNFLGVVEPAALADPVRNMNLALGLLEQFSNRWSLDPSKDFEQLFRCWNTGRPDGATYDPKYPDKGILRLEIYRQPDPPTDT